MNIQKIVSSSAFGIATGVATLASTVATNTVYLLGQEKAVTVGRQCGQLMVNSSYVSGTCSALRDALTGYNTASIVLFCFIPISIVGLGAFMEHNQFVNNCVNKILNDEPAFDEKRDLKNEVNSLKKRVEVLEAVLKKVIVDKR